MDFYKDETEAIKDKFNMLANIAKLGLDAFNESTFEKLLFSAFIQTKNASKYKIATQAHSGFGYLDLIIFFPDRADLYELKF